MSPVIPHPTTTSLVPPLAKMTSPQTGPANHIAVPVSAQQSQQPMTLGSSHMNHAQQMVSGQQVGTQPGQQGMPMMGNFIPAVSPQQMPLNLTMMPPPGTSVPTCQVALQPQMMPVSSVAPHQSPVVPGISQMPVIVSVQPGIDGLPHGMQHLPENVGQMTGTPHLVQVHPVPMTTLPMPPPLQPITCSDMPLPPVLQPLSVMSPVVQMPLAQAQGPVSVPQNNGNTTSERQPESPIYEVKLDTPVKDQATEKPHPAAGVSTPDKAKEENKSESLKVENGDDETIIAENVTITTESEDQNTDSSKTGVKVEDYDKCSKKEQKHEEASNHISSDQSNEES